MDAIQTVGEAMIGELKNGNKIFVMFNRACMTKEDISSARVTLYTNGDAREIYTTNNLGRGYELRDPSEVEKGKGLKTYRGDMCLSLLQSESEAFYDLHEQFQRDLSGLGRGFKLLEREVESSTPGGMRGVTFSCFSPNMDCSGAMTDMHIVPPESVRPVDLQNATKEEELRVRLMSDGFWTVICDLTKQLELTDKKLFDMRDCASAFFAKDPVGYSAGRKALPRLHDRMLCTDRVTSMMCKDKAVADAAFLRHPSKPWILTTIILVVPPEEWEGFMQRRKALETRFSCWFHRNRMFSPVSLTKPDGRLIVHYEAPDLSSVVHNYKRGAPVRIIEEPHTLLREDHLLEDASRVLADIVELD